MSLKEVMAKIFPAVYRTRSGDLVEITGFAFTGFFLNADGSKQEVRYVWDQEGNFIQSGMYHKESIDDDMMELVKSPEVDMTYRNKNVTVVAKPDQVKPRKFDP